jgi:chemotaxis response regulator CheB
MISVPTPSSATSNFPVVCIGLSMGSMSPLRMLFRQLNPHSGMAFVVVHHVRNVRTQLPEILSRCTSMPVTLAQPALLLRPNHVYVLPSGTEMRLANGHFSLRPRSKLWGYTNVLTIFLESMAKSNHPGIAVILSGLDADGSAALKSFREHGGITIIQEPQTAENPGMPSAAWNTGFVDYALPPAAIAGQLEALADRLGCLSIASSVTV